MCTAYRPCRSAYGSRVGYEQCSALTTSSMPRQRSWRSTVGMCSARGAIVELGLTQRMNEVCVRSRSSTSVSTSAPNLRATVTGGGRFLVPSSSLASIASCSKSEASSGDSDDASATASDGSSRSRFLESQLSLELTSYASTCGAGQRVGGERAQGSEHVARRGSGSGSHRLPSAAGGAFLR